MEVAGGEGVVGLEKVTGDGKRARGWGLLWLIIARVSLKSMGMRLPEMEFWRWKGARASSLLLFVAFCCDWNREGMLVGEEFWL